MHTHSVALFATIAVQGALADDTTRTNRVVCAIEAPICARASVERNETVIERSNQETRTREQLWSVPAWLRIVRIDKTGAHLLVETTPFATLPTDATEDFVILRIYSRGAVDREIRLKEVLPDPAALRAATDVGAWGKGLGSSDSGVATYLLASGRKVRVELESGKTTHE